ncbi:hypothetical protein EG329_013857 [Mollisiaceae sp. DMI_Dod_QoI]|nr:hypothetical protein EG329_013857 [Helotiales sp. DMI_Dod_QoI]
MDNSSPQVRPANGSSSKAVVTGTQKPNVEQVSFEKDLGTEIVFITVGTAPNDKTFPVHKTLLCRKVKHFNAMFAGNFIEALTQKASLPEDDVECFELFLTWVYWNSIQLPKSPEIESGVPLLVYLFAFAEKCQIDALADLVMDELVRVLKEGGWLPTPDNMESAYSCTHEKSKMRLFMARMYLYITFKYNEDEAQNTWNCDKMLPLTMRCQDLAADVFLMMRGSLGKAPADPRNAPHCD